MTPTAEQEIEHLAEQCSILLRENEKLREALQAIAACGADSGHLSGHDAENMALIARKSIRAMPLMSRRKSENSMAEITVWKDGKRVEATPLELVEQLEKYAFLADEEFWICSNWKAVLGERLQMAAKTIRALEMIHR